MGKQYKDSAYVHVSELILNYNQVKLQYVKSVSPDENQNIILLNISLLNKEVNAEGVIWTPDSHVFSVVLSQAELPRHEKLAI